MAGAGERWELLGGRAAGELAAAREQLHCAAQVVASVPRSLASPLPDWSHSAYTWDDPLRAMVSAALPGRSPFRVALRPADLRVLVLPVGGDEPLAELAAGGRSLDELFSWLAERAAELTGAPLARPLAEAEEYPPPPCGAGRLLDAGDSSALAELARYYVAASAALGAVAASRDDASPLRLWPHHLDLATLLVLDPGLDPEEARSVGVGMQPGDEGYPEPYFYVTPWPYPPAASLPVLAGGGRWHTEGWMGALLLGSDLEAAPTAAAQASQLDAFLRSAVGAALGLLDA